MPGEKLERFLETLPSEDGFVFGVPERLAVAELLLALVRRGEFPEDPRELKPLLAPLFCGNRAQQERFHAEFDREFALALTAVARVEAGPTLPRTAPWRLIGWSLAVLVLLGSGGLSAWLFAPLPALRMPVPPDPYSSRHIGEGGEPGPSERAPEGQREKIVIPVLVGRVFSNSRRPVRDADVWYAGQHQLTETDGSFEIRRREGHISLLIGHPAFNTVILIPSSTSGEVRVNLQPLKQEESVAIKLAAVAVKMRNGPGLPQPVETIFSQDGRFAATKSARGVFLWNVNSGQGLKISTGLLVNDFSFSPDGKYLATANRDSLVRLLSVTDGKQTAKYAQTAPVLSLGLSRDGKTLATFTSDDILHFFDIRTGTERTRVVMKGPEDSVFNPDFRAFLGKDSSNRLFTERKRAHGLPFLNAQRGEPPVAADARTARSRRREAGGIGPADSSVF